MSTSRRAKPCAKKPAMNNEMSPRRCSARSRSAAVLASTAFANRLTSGGILGPVGTPSYRCSARANSVSMLTTYCSVWSSTDRCWCARAPCRASRKYSVRLVTASTPPALFCRCMHTSQGSWQLSDPSGAQRAITDTWITVRIPGSQFSSNVRCRNRCNPRITGSTRYLRAPEEIPYRAVGSAVAV